MQTTVLSRLFIVTVALLATAGGTSVTAQKPATTTPSHPDGASMIGEYGKGGYLTGGHDVRLFVVGLHTLEAVSKDDNPLYRAALKGLDYVQTTNRTYLTHREDDGRPVVKTLRFKRDDEEQGVSLGMACGFLDNTERRWGWCAFYLDAEDPNRLAWQSSQELKGTSEPNGWVVRHWDIGDERMEVHARIRPDGAAMEYFLRIRPRKN